MDTARTWAEEGLLHKVTCKSKSSFGPKQSFKVVCIKNCPTASPQDLAQLAKDKKPEVAEAHVMSCPPVPVGKGKGKRKGKGKGKLGGLSAKQAGKLGGLSGLTKKAGKLGGLSGLTKKVGKLGGLSGLTKKVGKLDGLSGLTKKAGKKGGMAALMKKSGSELLGVDDLGTKKAPKNAPKGKGKQVPKVVPIPKDLQRRRRWQKWNAAAGLKCAPKQCQQCFVGRL